MRRFLVSFLCLLQTLIFLNAQEPLQNDTLYQMLSSLAEGKDSVRLKMLNDLANSNTLASGYLSYADLLLKEARSQRNSLYEGNALFLHIKYYYNNNTDSMYYWIQEAEPVFLETKQYEYLFRAKAWYIYVLTNEGRNEEALEWVNALKKQAQLLGYPDGYDMANQALANFYFSTNLPKEGVLLYEEILQGMEERKAPLSKRIYIVRQLLNKAPEREQRLKYLERLDEYIKDCEAKGIEQIDNDLFVYYLKYITNRNYALEYIQVKDVKQAEMYLDSAAALGEKYDMTSLRPELMMIQVLCCVEKKENEKALGLLDSLAVLYEKANRYRNLISVLDYQSNLLLELNRNRDAALAYKKLKTLNDSISRADFYQELAKMKTRHELDKLELKNQKMEMTASQTKMKMQLMVGGLLALTVICLSLGYLVYTVHKYGRQLKAAKEKAEEADRLKSAFLANMNHEIRTPLNAIVGFSEILIEENDKESREEYGQIIRNNNNLLQRLICDVLDISKIESDMIAFSYSDINLSALMKEVYSVIQLRMPDGVTLVLADSPAIVLYTDRNRLTQVLTNLLTNAIKHTERGSITFGYEVSETDVCFFVADTGEGIPLEQQHKIFSRFVQLNDWTQGVGLGLAICKGLVQKMGGHIGVSSEVGVGSRFTFTLPYNKKEQE